MTLKQRLSLIYSCLFSVILAVVMLVVYYLFADFRQEEFVDRLVEKAETTVKILVDVKEIDYHIQKTLDRNSINRLYKERTLVFDEAKQLIYSSSDTTDLEWSKTALDELKEDGRIFTSNRRNEVVGISYRSKGKYYFVLISAEDNYGNRKLNYLKYLLWGAFITGTSLVWLLSFKVSKRNLKPLDDISRQIQDITDKNLTVRLSLARNNDEISALASSFNQMMDRIDGAYNRQREFTGNASHELRTPVARLAAQLENVLFDTELPPAFRSTLTSMADDVFQLSEIISSLVTLTEVTNQQDVMFLNNVRLDEVVFNAAAQLSAAYPDFKLKFEIENTTDLESDLEITADETLLKIVVLNLFKNAYIYADNQHVECVLRQRQYSIEMIVTNTGATPDVKDTTILFNTFYRGSNTLHTNGSGIGLSIVKRILQYHKADVAFNILDKNTNQVIVIFWLQF